MPFVENNAFTFLRGKCEWDIESESPFFRTRVVSLLRNPISLREICFVCLNISQYLGSMFNIKKNLLGNELNVADARFNHVRDLPIVIYNFFFVFDVNGITLAEDRQKRMVVATLLYYVLLFTSCFWHIYNWFVYVKPYSKPFLFYRTNKNRFFFVTVLHCGLPCR